MHRSLSLGLLIVILLSGCSTSPQARLQRKWLELKEEDRARLLGEDKLEAKSFFGGIGERFGHLWELTTGNTAEQAATKVLDRNSPDARREGIYYLSDHSYGRRDPYAKQYARMAVADRDYTVRAAAIRALNRTRDDRYGALFMDALEDSSDAVRLEAAKALAVVPHEPAVPALVKHLSDPNENRDVRIAAADALRNFHNTTVAQALARMLADRDFAVAWQARRGLVLMTGQDFRYSEAAWLTWMKESRPFG